MLPTKNESGAKKRKRREAAKQSHELHMQSIPKITRFLLPSSGSTNEIGEVDSLDFPSSISHSPNKASEANLPHHVETASLENQGCGLLDGHTLMDNEYVQQEPSACTQTVTMGKGKCFSNDIAEWPDHVSETMRTYWVERGSADCRHILNQKFLESDQLDGERKRYCTPSLFTRIHPLTKEELEKGHTSVIHPRWDLCIASLVNSSLP
jgi:hypothetical protein